MNETKSPPWTSLFSYTSKVQHAHDTRSDAQRHQKMDILLCPWAQNKDLTPRSLQNLYQFLRTGDQVGFYNAVKWVNRQTVPAPKPSLFAFEYTQEAALKNSTILKKYDYDIAKAIEAQPNTIVSYGSEVRPMEQLDVLLHNHYKG